MVSVLCLFGFCLLAQVRPAKKGEQKPAKSKVYLLHSDVLKKSPLNPDPDAQILIGTLRSVTTVYICIVTVPVSMRKRIRWKLLTM